MSESTKQKGDTGEELACNYLKANGFYIVERNWRCGHLEIDIIAKRENPQVEDFSHMTPAEKLESCALHVIEVKTRKPLPATPPELAVNVVKQRHLISAANAYVRQKRIKEEVVFDIISVTIDKRGNHEIRFIPNAFKPRW